MIQALLQGRQTGAHGDLAPGGHEFLSRSRVQTPQNGKQRLVHALIPLNDATVKRRARYEDLRQLPSTLKPNDFMISLDVESAFFHVGIAPSHRKYFASHLAIPAFVKGIFIPLQPGGYWCCRLDNSPAHPSFDTPKHLQQYYYQVIEWSHYALALGWTASPRIWADVMNVVNCALKSQGIRTILYVDDLLAGCGNQQEAFMTRDIIAKTLTDSGIARSPTKGQWEPSQLASSARSLR